MKRRALLIAASPHSNPTPEVYGDIECWNRFLRSYLGGYWDDGEIKLLESPSRAALVAEIASFRDAEYALIVFVGAGRIAKTKLPWCEAQAFLSNGDLITEREFNTGSPRCTLVFDCCRSAHKQADDDLQIHFCPTNTGNPMKFREAYDASLQAAESGLVKVYAIGESPSFCGIILQQVILWSEENRGVLSLKDGISLVGKSLGKLNQLQPEYNGGRRLRHFPLAVNP